MRNTTTLSLSLLLLFALTACGDLFPPPNSGQQDSSSTDEYDGTFESDMTGYMTTTATGRANFQKGTIPPFSLRLRSSSPTFSITIYAPRRLEPGTYTFYEPNDQWKLAAYGSLRSDGELYHFTTTDGGTLRVTRSTPDRFQGSFDVDIKLTRDSDDSPAGTATLDTQFDAPPPAPPVPHSTPQ